MPSNPNPKISVILPVKNAPETLSAAVDSVLGQTFGDWELLLILDGSDAGTREAVKRLGNDPRLKIIAHDECGGISQRLNEGVAQARGEFIARMDADDICYPARLGKQLEFLENNPETDLVGSSALFFDPLGEPLGVLPVRERHEDICSDIFGGIRLAHPTWMGRREWFLKNRYDSRYDGVEDQELLLRACFKSRYANLPEVLLAYRENHGLAKSIGKRLVMARAQVNFLNIRNYWSSLGTMVWNSSLRIIADTAFFLSKMPQFHRRLCPATHEQTIEWHRLWTNTVARPNGNGFLPLVSVTMPVFNNAATLGPAIRSILAQTYGHWELLILDDGSTDGGVDLALSFADPRISVLVDGRKIKTPARLNQGTGLAHGKYLARMDADDLSFPERFSEQVAFLEAHPKVDLCATGVVVFNTKGEIIGSNRMHMNHHAICGAPYDGFSMAHGSWMGRIEWFQANPYDALMVRAQDQELLYRTYAKSCFACIPMLLFGYREDRNFKKMLRSRVYFVRGVLRNAMRDGKWMDVCRVLARQLLKTVGDFLNLKLGMKAFRNTLSPLPASAEKKWKSFQTEVD